MRGICFGALILWGVVVVAQEVEPAPATTEKAAPNIAQLKAVIDAEIDRLDVQEVLARVARAQAVLSRNGQAVLRDRAVVRLARDQARTAIERIESDPRVPEALERLGNEAVQQEFRRIALMKDKQEQKQAFQQFLSSNKIERTTLDKVVQLRMAQQGVIKCESVLEAIEEWLARTAIPVGVSAETTQFQLLDKVNAIAERYSKGGDSGLSGPDTAPPSDLESLFQALFGTSPARQN